MNGIIFDIKRFAVHDGPGIRTTVFLKECPLSCCWCHNPEGINAKICTILKTVNIGDKAFTENETIGRIISVGDLMKELMKEQIFMEESGGGVTFSGGEPLQQHDFLCEMLQACQAVGMHTAVDTTGFASWEVLAKVSKHTDLFLYDLKLINDTLHKEFTGVSNQLILSNLKRLLAQGSKVRIRIPLIPGITLTETNISETVSFLRELHIPAEDLDLLPFHNTAGHKYDKLGIKNTLKELKTLSKQDLNEAKKRFDYAVIPKCEYHRNILTLSEQEAYSDPKNRSSK